MAKIKSAADFKNPSVPKVVTNNKNDLLYMSRAPIPGSKKIDFNEFILNIWTNQLPEIYAGNFEMRQPTAGDKVLKKIGENFDKGFGKEESDEEE